MSYTIFWPPPENTYLQGR
ncbi:unnamed protein product [Linum tenue]|uniref:Uncharacterized protein n=1 Tax=Linum tenue TaxID=586396 RepID=A0AAV0S736_9ROSI|nr:unnamed protein product [Linum tenue]